MQMVLQTTNGKEGETHATSGVSVNATVVKAYEAGETAMNKQCQRGAGKRPGGAQTIQRTAPCSQHQPVGMPTAM